MTPTRAACCLIAATGLLSACGTPVPRTRAQTVAAADRSACRARADEIYNKQNRADVYRSDTYVSDTRDSPFSTSGLPGITSNGLSGLFQHDNLVSSCLNSSGSGGGAVGGSPSGPASTNSAAPPGAQ